MYKKGILALGNRNITVSLFARPEFLYGILVPRSTYIIFYVNFLLGLKLTNVKEEQLTMNVQTSIVAAATAVVVANANFYDAASILPAVAAATVVVLTKIIPTPSSKMFPMMWAP